MSIAIWLTRARPAAILRGVTTRRLTHVAQHALSAAANRLEEALDELQQPDESVSREPNVSPAVVTVVEATLRSGVEAVRGLRRVVDAALRMT